MSEVSEDLEMYVAGLVIDPASNAPIVVLKDKDGETCLPIWIGPAEANAIASALKNIPVTRPMTHDLLADVIASLGARVIKIAVTSLQENTFIAEIELVVGDVVKVIDARPSDAIALAVRSSAPIFVAGEVIDQAQVTLVGVTVGEDGEEEFEIIEATELEPDKNFADIDKEKWEEILSQMDPEDFKYKM